MKLKYFFATLILYCVSAHAVSSMDVSDFEFHSEIITNSGALDIARVYNENGTEKGINENIFNAVLDGYISVGVTYCLSSKLMDAETGGVINSIVAGQHNAKKNNYIKSFKKIGEFLFNSNQGELYLNTIAQYGPKNYCNAIKVIAKARLKDIRKNMS